MKKILVFIMSLMLVLGGNAQNHGIDFFHGTWAEGMAKAKQENKKVFIDFFTEWCGPCLNMALKVFTLPEVGYEYNKNFVCMKIDAEKGEGIELAKRYGVHSYPSYIFVDPQTEEMIHRSGSNKPAADFLEDIQGALHPELSSFYLNKKYSSGDYDADFLISYIHSRKVSGSRNLTSEFNKLISMGCKLTDKKVWDLFCECILGFDNPYIKQISDNYNQFVSLFGKEAVDEKLASATAYAPADFINSLCDFDGKDYNLKLSKMSSLFRDIADFDKAWAYVDELIADTTVNKQKFIKTLSFYTRVMPTYQDNDLTFDQLITKVRHTRYVAYNNYDRDDAIPHFNYAMALEYVIQRAIAEKKQIPADLVSTPKYGKEEYDMRHPLLKMKPSYKRKPKK